MFQGARAALGSAQETGYLSESEPLLCICARYCAWKLSFFFSLSRIFRFENGTWIKVRAEFFFLFFCALLSDVLSLHMYGQRVSVNAGREAFRHPTRCKVG